LFNSIKDKAKQEDSRKLAKVIQSSTGKKLKIWRVNFIIGFEKYKYHRKKSREEHQWSYIGFAPRKMSITIYLTRDISLEPLHKKLGKCTWGKGGLYIKKLADINMSV
jgi:hypothetical protein